MKLDIIVTIFRRLHQALHSFERQDQVTLAELKHGVTEYFVPRCHR